MRDDILNATKSESTELVTKLQSIRQYENIKITGHSLGGALA